MVGLLEFDEAVLKTVHGPRWRLLIIGAGQTSRYLAQMAMALDYHVTVCDPREEYAEEWSVPGVALVRGYPDDMVVQMNPDAHMAVVAVTHDPKLDDAALLEALKSPAFYVGALGSKKNNDARRRRLAGFDLSARRDRAPARTGRAQDRSEDSARDRGGDPRRNDRCPSGRQGAGARQPPDPNTAAGCAVPTP